MVYMITLACLVSGDSCTANLPQLVPGSTYDTTCKAYDKDDKDGAEATCTVNTKNGKATITAGNDGDNYFIFIFVDQPDGSVS